MLVQTVNRSENNLTPPKTSRW